MEVKAYRKRTAFGWPDAIHCVLNFLGIAYSLDDCLSSLAKAPCHTQNGHTEDCAIFLGEEERKVSEGLHEFARSFAPSRFADMQCPINQEGSDQAKVHVEA